MSSISDPSDGPTDEPREKEYEQRDRTKSIVVWVLVGALLVSTAITAINSQAINERSDVLLCLLGNSEISDEAEFMIDARDAVFKERVKRLLVTATLEERRSIFEENSEEYDSFEETLETARDLLNTRKECNVPNP